MDILATEIVNTKINNLVTKSNMLIEANYKLGVIEQKIILCLASNIQPTESEFKTYTLPIREFTTLLGLKGNSKYSDLRQITKSLMQKVFEIKIGKKNIQVAWISYVAYNESEGTIDIRFDPFLRPYLLELKREFTSYKLENVVNLKSTYAIRIYELLKQYEKINERTFTLTELREILGATDIYPAYGNFKQRVLIPAQRELADKTDITFKIEEMKVGRAVKKVKFIIQLNKGIENKGVSAAFADNLEEFKNLNSFKENVRKAALKLGITVPDEVIQSWEIHGQENVLALMAKLKNKKNIDNHIGYITAVLNKMSVDEKDINNDEQLNFIITLISKFRNSKEQLPFWFIEEESINLIQKHFNMNIEDAMLYFEEIKEQLFIGLEIEIPKDLKVNADTKRETLEARLAKYKR